MSVKNDTKILENREAVDKKTAIAVSNEIQEAIKTIFAKHNLELSKLSTKYGFNYSIKIEANAVEHNKAGVNIRSVEAQQWLAIGKDYGFANPEAQLGNIVHWNKKDFKFEGVDTKKSKFPVQVSDVATGKKYGVPYSFLKFLSDFDESAVNTWLAKSDLGIKTDFDDVKIAQYTPKAESNA